MVKKSLTSIARINMGYTFRGAVTHSDTGNTHVLQAKDIHMGSYIGDVANLDQVGLKIPRSNSFIEHNDILLVSKGSGHGSFKTTVYKAKTKNVIATSSLYIIRVTDQNILPEYLSLYLNSDDGQSSLFQVVSGSYIKSVTRQSLEGLKVPIPSLEKQILLVKLYQNIREQENQLERKNNIINNIMATGLKKVITN